MLKKLISCFLSIICLLNVVACSSSTATTDPVNKIYNIGTIQFIQHEALDKAYQGFKDYLDEHKIKFSEDRQNASGEIATCQTIADKFANENLDLIYAVATPAAQAIQAVNVNTPVIISAVTDPAASGLCETNDKPNGFITGASDLTPVDAQMSLLKELIPSAKKVGIFYCSTEANSKIQADMAVEALTKRGLESSIYTITNSNEIQTVMESMVGKVDAIYIPTDNTLAAGIETAGTIAVENKIPIICGEEGMCQGGGYATYGIDYYELGKIAGEMAVDVLVNGKSTKDMSVRYLDASKCKRYINKQVAEALGLPQE